MKINHNLEKYSGVEEMQRSREIETGGRRNGKREMRKGEKYGAHSYIRIKRHTDT